MSTKVRFPLQCKLDPLLIYTSPCENSTLAPLSMDSNQARFKMAQRIASRRNLLQEMSKRKNSSRSFWMQKRVWSVSSHSTDNVIQIQKLRRSLDYRVNESQEVKNTTHEFYETLERITNELRGMTVRSPTNKSTRRCLTLSPFP